MKKRKNPMKSLKFMDAMLVNALGMLDILMKVSLIRKVIFFFLKWFPLNTIATKMDNLSTLLEFTRRLIKL
ncbi:MAG: hypothetical protein ACFFCS_01150 [Candidatus Hodarchaeota archaeon]